MPELREQAAAREPASTSREPAVRQEARETPFQPRYVQLHALREHGHGRRNLAWGVVALFLALGLLGAGVFLAGPRALLSLAVCLLTFTALFVLARMHIFRQRNGGFLALGIVCLFGCAMPLVELGYLSLQNFANSRVNAPAEAAPSATSSSSATAAQPLILAYGLKAPDPAAGPRIHVIKDSVITIEGKPYLLRAGDLFALTTSTPTEVSFTVRDMLISLPKTAAEILYPPPAGGVVLPPPPSATAASAPPQDFRPSAAPEAPAANETPAQITARAQREIIRRYPALGVKGSLENQTFLNTFREIRDSGGDDFFANPEWPVDLGEMLAKREHWTRGAPPVTVSDGSSPTGPVADEPGTGGGIEPPQPDSAP